MFFFFIKIILNLIRLGAADGYVLELVGFLGLVISL